MGGCAEGGRGGGMGVLVEVFQVVIGAAKA